MVENIESKVIKKIDVVSLGKMSGAIFGGLGLFAGILMALYALAMVVMLGSEIAGSALGAGVAVVVLIAVIMYPITAAIMGFITGAIMAFVYNFVVRYVGGIKIEVE